MYFGKVVTYGRWSLTRGGRKGRFHCIYHINEKLHRYLQNSNQNWVSLIGPLRTRPGASLLGLAKFFYYGHLVITAIFCPDDTPTHFPTPVQRSHSEIPTCMILYNFTSFIRSLERVMRIFPLSIFHTLIQVLFFV